MQHVSVFGLPTPPASPSFDQKCVIPDHILAAQQAACQARFVPVAPEERLGRFLTDTLRLTGILGTGAYGVVYSAVDIKTTVHYAVKCLSKFNPDGTPLDRRQVAFQTREIDLHFKVSAHRNVVSMEKIIDNADCIYVILEYCPEGDLFFNITERGQYVGKDDLAKDVFLQILDAVAHCHTLSVYHRDLKPENILVTDQGRTVKLADFGLATSSDRSEDYGCGSTFYMSPECLDHASRTPFYFCAPNDVWSLGVILVNLTCGRNPWKQASFEDLTYRAFTRSPNFLKTILPVSDELNDILGRIFTRDPAARITLPELKARILACSQFTEQPGAMAPFIRPASSTHITEYAGSEEAIVDDDEDEGFVYDAAPLSPTSSDDSMSDGESDCSSDDGSVTSSCSSVEDLEEDDDFMDEIPEAKTPPPQPQFRGPPPMIYEPEEPKVMAFRQDFAHQYPGPFQEPVMQMPVPTQASCASKYPIHFWDMLKYQPAPQIHHPHPAFFHQVPLFTSMGCY